jgi:hypothetical protein
MADGAGRGVGAKYQFLFGNPPKPISRSAGSAHLRLRLPAIARCSVTAVSQCATSASPGVHSRSAALIGTMGGRRAWTASMISVLSMP